MLGCMCVCVCVCVWNELIYSVAIHKTAQHGDPVLCIEAVTQFEDDRVAVLRSINVQSVSKRHDH